MPAGIVENVDRGIVGYNEIFGGTWHGRPEYAVIDGPVPLEECKRVLGYTGVKVPVVLVRPDGTIPGAFVDTDGNVRMELEAVSEKDRKGNEHFVCYRAPHALNPDMYALLAEGQDRILSGSTSVGRGYRVFQNVDFLDDLSDLLDCDDVEIESCGTLHGLGLAFVNLKIGEFSVKGDESLTVNKVMLGNSFNGRSITACQHNTRIVCMNTLRCAEAEGVANKSLLKHKHTRNARANVEEHMKRLNAVRNAIAKHKAALDWMAAQPMTGEDVDTFLAALFPSPKPRKNKDGEMVIPDRAEDNAEARREVIKVRFDSLPDLQGGIRHTRYAALQAVTNWTSRLGRGENKNGKEGYDLTVGMPAKSVTDEAEVWLDTIQAGSKRDELNQRAYELLAPEAAEKTA